MLMFYFLMDIVNTFHPFLTNGETETKIKLSGLQIYLRQTWTVMLLWHWYLLFPVWKDSAKSEFLNVRNLIHLV